MSSTNKTSKLGLNKWLGTDIPSRSDFINDNTIIDEKLGNHLVNTISHLNSNERETWNTPYFATIYYGNGSSSRTVETKCPFNPTWGFIFAFSYTPSVCDFDNKSSLNYFTIFSKNGSMVGASIVDGKNVKVTQSAVPVQNTEFRNFNQNGVTYMMILFR